VFLLSACVDGTTQIAMIKGINIKRAAKDPERERDMSYNQYSFSVMNNVRCVFVVVVVVGFHLHIYRMILLPIIIKIK
jgi:hypothetical protein